MSEISEERVEALASNILECHDVKPSEIKALAGLALLALRERAEPVAAGETFDEWSRRCEIQLTLCRPEFREVAEITWNACRAAMLAAPGKN
ncbi:hypothetical protein ACOZWM_003256 [Cronobacter malonaticus]